MAVTHNPGDTAGALLDATITALSANVTAAAGTSTYAAAQLALAQAQAATVTHYMRVGRISASGALTALSLSAANLPTTISPSNAAKWGPQGTNIANRITALTTAAAGIVPGNMAFASSAVTAAQQLKAAQEELLLELVGVGATTHALVLSTLS